jgi:hypothetical protein
MRRTLATVRKMREIFRKLEGVGPCGDCVEFDGLDLEMAGIDGRLAQLLEDILPSGELVLRSHVGLTKG